jgi:hypothetical protein
MKVFLWYVRAQQHPERRALPLLDRCGSISFRFRLIAPLVPPTGTELLDDIDPCPNDAATTDRVGVVDRARGMSSPF